MSKTEDVFAPAIKGKKIPILTLDNKWHQLFTQTGTNKQILKLEEELNGLLKKQGGAGQDMKKIKKLKKKLMDEIVEYADDAASGRDKKAEKKLEENKRLINECNEKLDECEELLAVLPRQIDKVNKQLMLKTMEVCYDTLKENKEEIDRTTVWIEQVRTELKERLIRKQEQEMMNQELYAYMHDIFGADVIDMFDMQYLKKNE
ncbi:MAG: hypothetical protein IJ029_04950 [Lachnospiraceae bacterium]|nr:hypothetical protein [Lachnospiraceae bacterium]MBQ8878056.1 hypothetical protein [Lachnospiraceae bacterium]